MALTAKINLSKEPSLRLSLTALVFMLLAGSAFLLERYFRLSNQSFSFDYGFEIGRMLINFGGMALLAPFIYHTIGFSQKYSRALIPIWIIGFIGFVGLYIVLNKIGLYLLSENTTSIQLFAGVKKLMINFFHLLVLFYVSVAYVSYHGLKKKKKTQSILPHSQSFLVSVNGISRQLPIEKVEFLKTFDHYLKLYAEGKFYLIRESLKNVLKKLPDNFVQVHRTHVVNKAFIQSIVKKEGKHWLIMKDQTRLRISNSFKRTLQNQLSKD